MDFISAFLFTEVGVAAAVAVLILSGSALRAFAGRAADVLERRLSSPRRWS
jgi:hypothetical protein